MQETFRPPSKHYHLKNLHSTDYEIGGDISGDSTNVKDKYPRKQHFVRGKIPGGSASNKMIYGTNELLHQAKLNAEAQKPSGFLYGTDAATKVGKPAPGPLPNNVLRLEEKTEKDAAKHKKLATTQDKFLIRHNDEKQKKREAVKEEQKRHLEELKNYDPWGRPGAGAPRLQPGHGEKPDTHMTRNVKALVEQPDQNFGGRPGGGAPNRSESGRVHAVYKADRELRFPRHAAKPIVEPILRYGHRDENYKKELESSIEESRTRKQVQKQRSIEDERQHIQTDPFGREGGGAPQKSSQGIVRTAFPTTLSKDIQELRQLDRRHPYAYNQVQQQTGDPRSEFDPWGRGHGNPPVFSGTGRMVKPTQRAQENDLIMNQEWIGISVGRPGGGAPNVDRSGNLKVKKGQTLAKTTNGQTIQRDFSPKGDAYHPWGRGGAGAPIRGPDGEVLTRTAGRVIQDANDASSSARDSHAKHQYLTTLQKMREEAKEKQKAEHDDLFTTEKDVVTWLRGGAVGQVNYDPVTKEIIAQKKQTSDVTSQKFNIRRQKNEKSREYHVDLVAQAMERQQLRKNSQNEQRNKSAEHLKTMDTIWGRPGAGAPLGKENVDFARKQKLGLHPVDSSFTHRGA